MAVKKSNSKNKKNASLFSSAVLLLALLVIVIIFLVKKDQIFTNFKDTDFFGRIFGNTPEFVQNHQPSESKESDLVVESEPVIIQLKQEEKTTNIPANNSENILESKKEEVKEPVKEVKESVKQESVSENIKKTTEQKEVKPQTTQLQVCFVSIDGDGSVIRKPTKRVVPKSNSPLTEAINLLLKGPDYSNKDEKDLTTLIPAESKLLGARVDNGVAYLNFNAEFEFNPMGQVGSQNQLMQVVYTATQFSTVKAVQFLIEGEKQEYLGSEGLWIGSPLSKSNFNN